MRSDLGTNEEGSFQSDERWVERLLLGAKDYVQPTETLRGRTLDAAKERSEILQRDRRIGKALLAVATGFWMCTLAWPFFAALQAEHTDRHVEELERRSLYLHSNHSMEIQSATAQAYEEWRVQNLNRFSIGSEDSFK